MWRQETGGHFAVGLGWPVSITENEAFLLSEHDQKMYNVHVLLKTCNQGREIQQSGSRAVGVGEVEPLLAGRLLHLAPSVKHR